MHIYEGQEIISHQLITSWHLNQHYKLLCVHFIYIHAPQAGKEG